MVTISPAIWCQDQLALFEPLLPPPQKHHSPTPLVRDPKVATEVQSIESLSRMTTEKLLNHMEGSMYGRTYAQSRLKEHDVPKRAQRSMGAENGRAAGVKSPGLSGMDGEQLRLLLVRLGRVSGGNCAKTTTTTDKSWVPRTVHSLYDGASCEGVGVRKGSYVHDMFWGRWARRVLLSLLLLKTCQQTTRFIR